MKRATFVACSAAAAVSPRASFAEQMKPAEVVLGDEIFLRESWRELGNRAIGIVTNQTGVTSQLESLVDAARRNTAITVKALFSPEHGLRGDQTAGAYVASYTDPTTGLPVYSLYGPTRHPSEAMLSGIDVLLFDIQDVGARTYTYASTMAYVMEAAAQYGKEVWILDRPNPAGGAIVEGPVLEPQFKSFIGLYPVAMRHGMTFGELARMLNDAFGIRAKLRVISMRGYRRSMVWPDTGLWWVQSSPNIPTWRSAMLMPCTGLIASMGINNATGTAKPFSYAGAYGMDAERYAAALNVLDLPGVWFRAAAWSTFGGFWANKTLTGVEIVIEDPHEFLAVRTAVELLVTARSIMPRTLSLHNAHSIDMDWGTDSIRTGLLDDKSSDEIVRGWAARLDAFKALRSKYLLYG